MTESFLILSAFYSRSLLSSPNFVVFDSNSILSVPYLPPHLHRKCESGGLLLTYMTGVLGVVGFWADLRCFGRSLSPGHVAVPHPKGCVGCTAGDEIILFSSPWQADDDGNVRIWMAFAPPSLALMAHTWGALSTAGKVQCILAPKTL